MANIGAYQEVVAALVSKIPGRLAERAMSIAEEVVTQGWKNRGGQKSKQAEAIPTTSATTEEATVVGGEVAEAEATMAAPIAAATVSRATGGRYH